MNTVLEMIGLLVLTVLYALAWHNQPAREPAPVRRTTPEVEPHPRATLTLRGGL